MAVILGAPDPFITHYVQREGWQGSWAPQIHLSTHYVQRKGWQGSRAPHIHLVSHYVQRGRWQVPGFWVKSLARAMGVSLCIWNKIPWHFFRSLTGIYFIHMDCIPDPGTWIQFLLGFILNPCILLLPQVCLLQTQGLCSKSLDLTPSPRTWLQFSYFIPYSNPRDSISDPGTLSQLQDIFCKPRDIRPNSWGLYSEPRDLPSLLP